MPLVFLDTEFTDFIDTRLISVGCVSEDGREFYVEISDYDRRASSTFVRDTVEPLLDNAAHGKPFLSASAALHCWLSELAAESRSPVVLCPDHPTDFELVRDLLDGDFPPGCEDRPLLVYDAMASLAGMAADPQSPEWLFDIFENACGEFFQRFPGMERHRAIDDALSNRFGFMAVADAVNSPRHHPSPPRS